MLRATNHAGITVCNRDRESGFPKCLPQALPGDPRSNFHRLILLCHSNPVWVPVSPLELLSLVVKTIGTKSIPRCSHRSLYFLVFVSSAALVRPCQCIRVEKGLTTCTGTRVADCSRIHYFCDDRAYVYVCSRFHWIVILFLLSGPEGPEPALGTHWTSLSSARSSDGTGGPTCRPSLPDGCGPPVPPEPRPASSCCSLSAT